MTYGPQIVSEAILIFLPTVYIDQCPSIRELGINILVHVTKRVEVPLFYEVVDVLVGALKRFVREIRWK